jgi:hypothetical protein
MRYKVQGSWVIGYDFAEECWNNGIMGFFSTAPTTKKPTFHHPNIPVTSQYSNTPLLLLL